MRPMVSAGWRRRLTPVSRRQVSSGGGRTSPSEAPTSWTVLIDDVAWAHLGSALLPRPGNWRRILRWVPVLAAAMGWLLAGTVGAVMLPIVSIVSLRLGWKYVDARHRRECLAALPDALTLIASALAAGHSLGQAVTTAVRAGGPLAGELARVEARITLGESAPDALTLAADRLDSEELRWVVVAIRINARIGGDLATLLTTIAATLRERESLRRTARVLSAEGRLSAWVLGALPVGFVALLLVLRPEQLAPLVSDARGVMLVLLACTLFITGVLWLRRAVALEI